MDEDAFSEADFDAYAWVEDAIAERQREIPALAQVLPHLTLRAQALTGTIHATLQQLRVLGPQVQTHVLALQSATVPLLQELDAITAVAVKPTASSSNSKSGESATQAKQQQERDWQHLVTLHDSKQRMQTCAQSLVEAAKWGKNIRLCTTALASMDDASLMDDQLLPPGAARGSVTLAARVREMQTSLEVWIARLMDSCSSPSPRVCAITASVCYQILKDMPGADERARTLKSVCGEIEQVMRPKLAAWLRQDHVPVAKIQSCLDLFVSIRRPDIVQEEFCSCRPAALHRVWFAYARAGQSGDPLQGSKDDIGADDDQLFSSWLDATFFSDLHRMLQREAAYIREIFGSQTVVSVLIALLEQTLTPLVESFRTRIRETGDAQELLRSFQSSNTCAGRVIEFVRTLERAESSLIAGDGANTSSVRLLKLLMEPYRVFFTEYTQIAGTALSDRFMKLVPHVSPDQNGTIEDFAQRVEDIASDLWSAVDESLRECYEWTAGAAFPEALVVIESAVQAFTAALRAELPSMRKFCRLDSMAAANSAEMQGDAPDWSNFHACLALLKACGALESELDSLESRIHVRVREQVLHLLGEDRAGSPRHRLTRKQSLISEASLDDLLNPAARVTMLGRLWLHDDPTRQSAFQEFAHDRLQVRSPTHGAASTRAVVLLAPAKRYLREWTGAVQQLTYDTVFFPIASRLATVPANASYSRMPDAALGDLPSFSTLPQEYITMVADLLLSLLPQLEPFAESTNLQTASIASMGLQHVCEKSWSALGQTLQLSAEQVRACQRIFSHEGAASDETSVLSSATEFVDLWTSAVSSGTVAAWLGAICLIPRISPQGAKQLSADLGYFQNVLSAVGGSSSGHMILDDLRKALELSVDEHAQHVDALGSGAVEEVDVLSAQILIKLHASLVLKRRVPEPSAALSPSSTSPLFF